MKRLLPRRTAPPTAAALPVANLLSRASTADSPWKPSRGIRIVVPGFTRMAGFPAYGTPVEFDTFGKAQRRHCWQKIDFPAFPVFPAESVVWRLKTDPHG